MEPAALRAQFPVLTATAYLNAGTCGPVPAAAQEAATAAWRLATDAGRGWAFHGALTERREALRTGYAALLGAAPADVALTLGTSDGVGRVVAGLALRPGDEILTADDEHPGLQGPLLAAREQRGVTLRAVPLAELPGAVSPATRLVACSHVSWRSGAFAPVGALLDAAGDVPVLLDGAQGVGAVPVDVAALGVAFYAGSGQKWLCGPLGCGMLWLSPAWAPRIAVPAPSYDNLDVPARGLDARLAPDARRFDTGSQDLPTAAAALAALDVLGAAGWDAVHARAATLAARLAAALGERGHDVTARDASTLVSWCAGDDDAAAAVRDRLAAAGVVVRDLPGTGRLRAAVGAWNDEDDLDRLLAGL